MTNSSSLYKNIGITTAIIAGIGTYLFIHYLFTPKSVDEQLAQAALIMNKACPVMVDDETRLDSAAAIAGNIFQYYYTLVHLEKATTDIDGLKAQMQPYLQNTVKTNPGLKTFRNNNTTMRYQYNDKNGSFLFVVEISTKEYQ